MGFYEDHGDLQPPPEPFRFGRRGQRPLTFRWLGLAALVLVAYLVITEIGRAHV